MEAPENLSAEKYSQGNFWVQNTVFLITYMKQYENQNRYPLAIWKKSKQEGRWSYFLHELKIGTTFPCLKIYTPFNSFTPCFKKHFINFLQTCSFSESFSLAHSPPWIFLWVIEVLKLWVRQQLWCQIRSSFRYRIFSPFIRGCFVCFSFQVEEVSSAVLYIPFWGEM